MRLLNTDLFGKSVDDPIVMLSNAEKGGIYPESVFLDIDDSGVYYASTVRYPLALTLEGARKQLNRTYGKWEKADFANDPTMGLWRNEDDKFAIQLTEDEDSVVVIYISYERAPQDRVEKALEKALLEMDLDGP